MKTDVENLVGFIEKAVIAIILVATITAIMFEIMRMIEVQYVELADLLLLFIYVEVIGMVRVYYVSNRCLLYTSPSPRDGTSSRMPSSA